MILEIFTLGKVPFEGLLSECCVRVRRVANWSERRNRNLTGCILEGQTQSAMAAHGVAHDRLEGRIYVEVRVDKCNQL